MIKEDEITIQRLYEIFCFDENESTTGLEYDDDNGLKVFIIDNDSGEETVYLPDMSDRPHALAYVLGKLDSFDD